MNKQGETKAVIATVLGVLALPVPLIGWLLGIMAISYARTGLGLMDERNPKRWYAITGMVCGITGVVMDIGLVLLALVFYFIV